ncbi:MAG: hypothetical protein NT069_11965 [Planctomycetota bacterium]|nr:hypothetical protein [Planctomycetota bacterium]
MYHVSFSLADDSAELLQYGGVGFLERQTTPEFRRVSGCRRPGSRIAAVAVRCDCGRDLQNEYHGCGRTDRTIVHSTDNSSTNRTATDYSRTDGTINTVSTVNALDTLDTVGAINALSTVNASNTVNTLIARTVSDNTDNVKSRSIELQIGVVRSEHVAAAFDGSDGSYLW